MINSIKNCEVYNSFSSNHRLLTAKIKLGLKILKLPKQKTHHDWTPLRNIEIWTVTVRTRFSELCSENDNVAEIYSHFEEENEQAAEKIIPTKKKIKSTLHLPKLI